MKIKIVSLDTHGQNYNQEFELIKIINLETQKEYHYNDEYGFCKIIIKDEGVEIFRKGIINSKQVFKLGKKTSFSYITEKFKGKYEIFTEKLDVNNGKILLKYDIIDNSELINKIKLEISY